MHTHTHIHTCGDAHTKIIENRDCRESGRQRIENSRIETREWRDREMGRQSNRELEDREVENREQRIH